MNKVSSGRKSIHVKPIQADKYRWCNAHLPPYHFLGAYTVLDIAFNPEVLEDCKKDKAGMDQVYMLALSFAQQQHGLMVSQKYNIVSLCPKNGPEDLRRRLGFQQQQQQRLTTDKQSNAGRVISQRPDKPLQAFFVFKLIFHFPLSSITIKTLIYSQSEPGLSPGADQLSAAGQRRHRAAGWNRLSARRSQKGLDRGNLLHHVRAAWEARVSTRGEDPWWGISMQAGTDRGAAQD